MGAGFVVGAAVISIPLRPWLQFVPSTVFVLAVMLASWYGGRAAGLFATGAAVVAMDLVLFEPLYTLAPNPVYIPSAFVFAVCALVVAGLTSSRRAAQSELMQLNETLEDRVTERTTELQRVNSDLRREIELRCSAEQELERKRDELLASNSHLNEFVCMASHDLQEPLRTISTFSDLLLRRHSSQLPEEAADLLPLIHSAAHGMRRLLDELLAYARADGDCNPQTWISLEQIFRAVRDDLRGSIEESHARIVCDPLPEVWGHAPHLSRVIQNLISNAVKYRREESPHVHVWAYSESGSWVVCIRDNGLGFAQSEAETIFKPFKRLHDRSIPGTGMGLAICRKIIERHGGRIWAESVPGQGSVFRFSLPQAQPAAQLPLSSGLDHVRGETTARC